jgi:hypothetical protein
VYRDVSSPDPGEYVDLFDINNVLPSPEHTVSGTVRNHRDLHTRTAGKAESGVLRKEISYEKLEIVRAVTLKGTRVGFEKEIVSTPGAKYVILAVKAHRAA